MDQVNPDFIGAVLEIWDDARFDGLDFYSEFGPRTLQRLFEIHPESKEVFGVNQNPKMFQARVDAHAKSLVLLVDGVFQMLTNQLTIVAYVDRGDLKTILWSGPVVLSPIASKSINLQVLQVVN